MDVDTRHADLRFALDVNIRAYSMHAAFFSRLATALAVVNISCTIGIFGILAWSEPSVWWLRALALVLGVASAVELAVRPGERAGANRAAVSTLAAIDGDRAALVDPSPEAVGALERRFALTDGQLPELTRALQCMAYNDAVQAQGSDRRYLVTIGPWHKVFAHVFDWRPSSLARPAAE